MRCNAWFWIVAVLHLRHFVLSDFATPPLPVLPIPSESQLKWHRRELIMFFHFGMNTFTDSEWGTGEESPSLFDPANLNAGQWMDAAEAVGASLVILTAKHHDGFCLWPSRYTDHSVEKSPWKGGKGDVVREFVNAASARRIDVGLYLSPWDRHEKTYGQEVEYNEFYMAQLHELLTKYGSISEIWFDGAKGANATKMNYYFKNWFETVKQLQSSINIFSDAGPDVRWVGDEMGAAGATCWSIVNRTLLRIGDASLESYLNTGDPRGTDWVPPECDVSIRPGWFWHKNQTAKSVSQLLNIYYNSVGRNCVLLLNVPPNRTGLVSSDDTQRLKDFRKAITSIFSADLAAGSKAKASSERGGRDGGFAASNVLDSDDKTYWAAAGDEQKHGHWIELALPKANTSFNLVRVQEAIALGQRIMEHEVYADKKLVAKGTTVGYKRLHRLREAVTAARVKIRITKSRGPPLLTAMGLHYDRFTKCSVEFNKV
ncbi:alpha-L-fucosidase 1-like [Zingiber officinale]|uniref:alpha-L-fucosidase 1-like n=1 Tax=Zingiber officinale TaxID=94328 RepID=UPI001C4B9EDE|nr:alpha-L-fucosidase 1-like [Zingiber officinale]